MGSWKTRWMAGAVAAAGLATSACSSDPALWEAVAMGLDQAAAELEYENAYCYGATPPGLPYGASQRYCPGDYGYRDLYIPPESPYWRDRYRDLRRDQGPPGPPPRPARSLSPRPRAVPA